LIDAYRDDREHDGADRGGIEERQRQIDVERQSEIGADRQHGADGEIRKLEDAVDQRQRDGG
jgi:hypothetical protein